MTNLQKPSGFLAVLFFLSACSPVAHSNQPQLASNEQSSEAPADPAQPVNPVTSPALRNICSKLDLANIKWPSELGGDSWSMYFALALNITGSFEGGQGWKNIANNFDGQGMSLGLMQQNFGQGSLQPLLIKMFKQDNSSLLKLFTNPDYLSLKAMLEDWQNGTIVIPSSVSREELFPNVDVVNELDRGSLENPIFTQATNQNLSVQWAVNNLYTSGNFISRWKKSFQDAVSTSVYRTIQVEASTSMFLKAKKYLAYFKFKQLSSVLFFYDVVVQNGSFTANDLANYNSWLSKNPATTEQARALALADILAARVNPKYAEDVRTRKASIIKGAGSVHGNLRNFPKEFCYQSQTLIQ